MGHHHAGSIDGRYGGVRRGEGRLRSAFADHVAPCSFGEEQPLRGAGRVSVVSGGQRTSASAAAAGRVQKVMRARVERYLQSIFKSPIISFNPEPAATADVSPQQASLMLRSLKPYNFSRVPDSRRRWVRVKQWRGDGGRLASKQLLNRLRPKSTSGIGRPCGPGSSL